MCGIAGFIDKNKTITQKERGAIVKKMLLLMKHRGGDAFGIKSIDNITLGHTRLSIVDLSKLGNQPFSDNQHSMLSFNGEIYNHEALRRKYLNKVKISSNSDTATLFELLRKYPIESTLEKIQGMFAFSFLNSKEHKVILVLDRFAIKPLYYIDTPKYFAWASEIKAFKAIPGFSLQINEPVLGEYMVFRHVVGPDTLFKNIRKMQAGEFLTYNLKNNTVKTRKYYQLKKKENAPKFSESVISESIKDHLMGDIVAGVQLSGGVDSSLVALFAQKFSKRKLHTFSIGLADDHWNEFHYSDIVANKLDTKHHKIIFSKSDFARLLPKVIYHLDEPLVHPNTVPMYILAKEARRYTKVLLTGEGADEVFYGYNRYFKKPSGAKNVLFSNTFSNQHVVSQIFKGKISIANRKKILCEVSGVSDEDKISFYDIYTYLPHVLLRQDKAGMAANIENRVPFLYTFVVEAGLNSKTRIGKFGGKTQIKEIALKYFPKELVLRQKCGFGLPILEWLRDKDVLLPYLIKLTKHKCIKKYFVISEIERLIDKHLHKEENNSSVLFTLICLSIWYDAFIN